MTLAMDNYYNALIMPRALDTPGKHSATELHIQPMGFEIRYQCVAQPGLELVVLLLLGCWDYRHGPPYCAACIFLLSVT